MKYQVTDLPREVSLSARAVQALERMREEPGSANYADDPLLRHACYCSEFITAAVAGDPALPGRLLGDGALETPFRPERLRLPADAMSLDEPGFMRALRLLRRDEMVRIALRDLGGRAELEETLYALSTIADFCLRQACDYSRRVLCGRHGEPFAEDGAPLSLIVLALGKLGGGELNFSSDIDVMFAFAEHGRTRPGEGQHAIEAEDFFTRQARLVVKYLHEITADGFVFRVDTRLRPFGESGPLAASFDFMETYYQNQGRDCERYALIKARPVCGGEAESQRLMKLLQPFVYRRYLDYGAFAALREMKALIMREVARKGMRDNVKLGPGGIREIEFTAQAFQLIRGGREPEFRQRELMPVLRALGMRRLLSADAVRDLSAAYRFLRIAENRLQMIADQQTHRLPQEPQERARLSYAMGFADWDGFNQKLDEHRARVSEVFTGIFHTAQEPASVLYLADLLDGRLPEPQALAVLEGLGFTGSEAGSGALEALRKFRDSHQVRHMGPEARSRLERLLEPLFKAVARTPNAGETLERVLKVIQAIVQRSVYIALLCEYPDALSQLVRLCSSSGWIADYLQAQPILLDSLLDSRFLYELPDRQTLGARLRELMEGLAAEDFELQLNALRHYKHEQVLRVAALDVNGDLPLMKVSDQLTWLAEAILEQAHAMAGKEMLQKYGLPWCGEGAEGYQPELAVIAYGKLGGIELGYSSDLDVVFLHNSRGEGQTRSERPIANEVFFARYGQRMIQILGTQMSGGVLYEVDPRLRPDGNAGPLVGSLHGYAAYQRERAWVWEHQALVRSRMVVGNAEFRAEFEALRAEILCRPRDLGELRAEVRDMRNRMRAELARGREGAFDLKQDRGGITDIEFIVQYGVLAWARDFPELTHYPDNIRILEQFERCSLLPAEEARLLTEAYRHLRGKIHRLALQGHQALLEDASSSRVYIDGVSRIWDRLMET
jgi:[glutamine synthetase] adenylyltransferase / [glutamine synthetase]-adenylyl-L-tyrosine phosphorylase